MISQNHKNKEAKLEKNNKNLNIKLVQLDSRLQNFEKLLIQLDEKNKTLNWSNNPGE